METLTVGHSEVLISRGLPVRVLPERPGRSCAAVLTQPGATAVATTVADRLRAEGLRIELMDLPDREAAKTLDVARSVYHRLAELGLNRSDVVVAVGGGSVTDLAGFVAGTWLRGVELVNVPTTLLGAVDASIGGKAGIDLEGKNLVGVFWPPSRVLIDLELITGLPEGLLREGMAEVLKAGLVGSPRLVEELEARGVGADLEYVVPEAIRVKAAVVAVDERDSGPRMVLNFGHTVGHAIEMSSSLAHGESVALGMIAAGVISQEVEGFPGLERIRGAIGKIGLPGKASGVDGTRVRGLLRLDKKRDAGGTRMVLLRQVGAPVIRHVDADTLETGLGAVGV